LDDSNHLFHLIAGKPEEIPTVFSWKHGGKAVYLTGSFNDWKEKIPLKQASIESFSVYIACRATEISLAFKHSLLAPTTIDL
jgi:hypothetical protein